jgi:hypothetical protein
MLTYLILTYSGIGFIWLYLTESYINSTKNMATLFKLILIIILWPLSLIIRIERANRIGKFLKPHSKWQLILKNKVINKFDKE